MKKGLLIIFCTLLIFGFSTLYSSVKTSAVSYVNVTPSEQTISGELGSASWSIGWGGGYRPYTLTFQEDFLTTSSITLLRGYTGTSYKYTHRYMLPTGVNYKDWNSRFRVIDDYGFFSTQSVSVKQWRFY